MGTAGWWRASFIWLTWFAGLPAVISVGWSKSQCPLGPIKPGSHNHEILPTTLNYNQNMVIILYFFLLLHCLLVGMYNSSLLQYISVALLLLLLRSTWQILPCAGLPFSGGSGNCHHLSLLEDHRGAIGLQHQRQCHLWFPLKGDNGHFLKKIKLAAVAEMKSRGDHP